MKNKSKIMKVLTVKQPWGILICAGIKDIENRTWKLPEKYRGERVLIHASEDRKLNLMHLSSDQYIDFLNKIDISTLKPCDQWPRSAIIGSVEIVDCVINHPSVWAEKGVYNWVLANPILFEKPILNVKGKLGFWNYDLPEEYETILKL